MTGLMIVGNFEYIVGGLLAEFDDICREIFKYIVGGSWRSLRKSFWIFIADRLNNYKAMFLRAVELV